jgi:hypothetical protein
MGTYGRIADRSFQKTGSSTNEAEAWNLMTHKTSNSLNKETDWIHQLLNLTWTDITISQLTVVTSQKL